MPPTANNGGGQVAVLVRIRPMLPRELQFDNAVEALSVSGTDRVLLNMPCCTMQALYVHTLAQPPCVLLCMHTDCYVLHPTRSASWWCSKAMQSMHQHMTACLGSSQPRRRCILMCKVSRHAHKRSHKALLSTSTRTVHACACRA